MEVTSNTRLPERRGGLLELTSDQLKGIEGLHTNEIDPNSNNLSLAAGTTDFGPQLLPSPTTSSPVKSKKQNVQGQVGLQNLGNTCYMNSVLQCLAHEPEFFSFFAEPRRIEDYVERGIHNGKHLKEKSLTRAFQQLFRDYWSSKWDELEPREFKSRVGEICTQFDNYQQHDGQEFLAALLDTIHEELSDLSKAAPLPQVHSIISDQLIGDSPDSAFLSAGSSTDNQLSPESRVRKRQNSDSSLLEEKCKSPSPSSPDSSGSVNLELTKLSVSSEQAINQPAKRPRLTSECTLESEDPAELWRRYMETNDSFVSTSFQGQFASELTCSTCAHSSKTYEPFMYLTLPVPNPAQPTFTVNFTTSQLNGLIKVAITIDKNAKISQLIKMAVDTLQNEENKSVVSDALKLYEFDGKKISRLLDNEWTVSFVQSSSELLLVETLSIIEESKIVEIDSSCKICLCEQEQLLQHRGCVFRVCQSCSESDHIDPTICPHCKKVIDGFEPVTDATSSNIVEVDETVTCTISFRDYNDQPISIPCAFKISKSINSAKIYEQLTVLLYGVCEAPEFELYYTNQSGDCCSRCTGLTSCSGCRVPENFDVELKRYDNFKVVTSATLDLMQTTSGRSQRDYEENRPTLAKCLDEFRKPELLEENNVYCQKCKCHTGAQKKVTVQRWPDTLIVYLKRFVYLSEPHPHAKKIETEIIFEHNVDVSHLSSPGQGKQDKYNLVGSIQHFGGISSGHYTAYASDPITKNWAYYNDQSTTLQEPGERDAKSVYILFYRRQNSHSPSLQMANSLKQECPEDYFGENVHRTSPVPEHSNLMSLTHDDISEHLRKKLGGSVSSLESLKAEGGGSRSSLNESLNLEDFENDTEFHQTPIPSPTCDLPHGNT